MENVARIVLGVEEHDVAEEVMHFLDRTGTMRVVATAADEQQLAEAIRQLEPDAVVASPRLAHREDRNGSKLLALATRETVASLRAAMRAGADGYFVWPGEREELAGAAASMLPRSSPEVGGKRARVISVYAPRGGSGATFVATHLSASIGRRGSTCVLVDMDPVFADLTTALGVPSGEAVRTIADLLPLGGEVAPEHLDGVLWRHPAGFDALLAPEPDVAARLRGEDYRAALSAIVGATDVVVLHLARTLDDIARRGLAQSDRILMVLSLDVFSFRSARRALPLLGELGLEDRCDFVVNRARRSEIVPNDVRRAFGKPPLAVIPSDRSVGNAQDRGRLLPARGRATRGIDRLAASLLEGSS
jgi:pilus assembly protein CpaE